MGETCPSPPPHGKWSCVVASSIAVSLTTGSNASPMLMLGTPGNASHDNCGLRISSSLPRIMSNSAANLIGDSETTLGLLFGRRATF